jgi:hypothetical protein
MPMEKIRTGMPTAAAITATGGEVDEGDGAAVAELDAVDEGIVAVRLEPGAAVARGALAGLLTAAAAISEHQRCVPRD